MQVLVSFRHMEPSEALREYAQDKLTRVVRKYIKENVDAQVTLKVEKFRHIANLHLHHGNLSIKCEEASDDMYSSIDIALDKLERQVRRYKEKRHNYKGSDTGGLRSAQAPIELHDDEYEDDDDDI